MRFFYFFLAIIDRINEICIKNGVQLVISMMSYDEVSKRLINHCQKKTIKTIDITIDLAHKGLTNAQYDPHPSIKAHEIYARKLTPYLKKQLTSKLF